jgi:CheY-like chemotaxis protein
MQLALQDFDVEVKAVPIGLDVLEVSRSFQPEIIFADVLLSKRNGYEVCAELKGDRAMYKVPVVLMWSGFMDIDEKKAAIAKPDRRLEKPFDAETLRNLVRDLVPRLQTNVISQYLSFPNLPEIEEDEKAKKYAEKKRAKELGKVPETSRIQQQLADTDEEEEFQSVPLPKIPPQTHETRSETPEDWARQDLAQFKIPTEEVDLTRDYDLISQDLSNASIAVGNSLEAISLEEMDLDAPVAPKPTPKQTPTPPVQPKISTPTPTSTAQNSLPSMTQLSHERVEQVLREHVREVLENIAWKILPDMAERIVREEIQKLMKDADRI